MAGGSRPGLVVAGRVALATLALAACAPLADLGLDTRPVSINEPLDDTTRGRLMHATADPADCDAWLAGAGLTFTPAAEPSQDEACQVTAPGELRDTRGQIDARLSPARPLMACRLAAAVAVWRRQSVEPAAREILGADVKEIDHLGTYACRNVDNQLAGPPSAHARGEAIDVAGFRLGDGRKITVAKDWAGDGLGAAFLHRVHDDACRLFGTTLSPAYNAAHANHLHLEIGGFGGVCS